MRRLFLLLGKSASGKDAMYQYLLKDSGLSLKPYVGYTTRPQRSGETDGLEYYFVTQEDLDRLEEQRRVIEKRIYQTIHGDWTYFSVDSERLNPDQQDYLYIGTLESYLPIRDYYGADRVIPVYIFVEDGLRLQRALDRERAQKVPRYAEMCRRFLADEQDFSEEHLQEAGIRKRFENLDFDTCREEICTYIRSFAE